MEKNQSIEKKNLKKYQGEKNSHTETLKKAIIK